MDYESFYNGYKKKIMTSDFIKETFHLQSQSDLKTFIDSLVEKNHIIPIGKELTYLFPQVSKKYKIIKPEYQEQIYEMDYQYHNSLNFDYYKKHVKVYETDKKYILLLSDYLKNGKIEKSKDMSINERSFDIFGDEKFLASKVGTTLLGRLKLQVESFHLYPTPEPFFYYFNPKIHSEYVLIIENKDTWYTVRQLIRDMLPICGISFCAVIILLSLLTGFMNIY